MTASQQSQYMRDILPPGQNRRDQTPNRSQLHQDIDRRIDSYNAHLIVSNSNDNNEAGVNDMLIALKNRDDKLKLAELNKIRKEPLQAGLGFQEGIKFGEANVRYKGVRVDELRAQIIAIYNNSIPRECGDCSNIFNNGDLTVKITYCFMCNMKICPRCVPAQSAPPSGYVPICSVCRSNYGHERHKERMAAQQELGSSEVNKSVSEETFLDVTMKSKGSSTPKKSSNHSSN